MSADDLHAAQLAPLLDTERFGRSLEVRERTASTNDDARQALLAGAADGHVVVADAQTAGRGARGRTWQSPPGCDLYLSIVAHPGLPLTALPPVTLAVGLGVARCLDPWADGKPVEIKWPNDVLLGGAKIAGVLVETVTLPDREHPGAILGIGLNVGRTEFPKLDFPATSLALSTREAPSRVRVLAALLGAVEAAVDALRRQGPDALCREIDARLALRNRRVTVEALQGTVQGVAPDGRLRLATDGGESLVAAGRLRPVADP